MKGGEATGKTLVTLSAEKTQIEKSLRQQAKLVAVSIDHPNAAARLVDLEQQIRAGENRMAEIAKESVALELAAITSEEVYAAAASCFRSGITSLTVP